jgi:hypothetical protein
VEKGVGGGGGEGFAGRLGAGIGVERRELGERGCVESKKRGLKFLNLTF